ncbi:hypothetical protein [Pseudooceanicola sp. C21-150M6]
MRIYLALGLHRHWAYPDIVTLFCERHVADCDTTLHETDFRHF